MRRRLPLLFGFAALILALGVRLVDPAPVQLARTWVFDTYQRIKPRPYQPAGVRIVDIDEASLRRLGQWPWPRSAVAEMIDRLRAMDAAVIAFDIVFAEPDRTAPDRLLAAWKRHGLTEDAALALASLPDPDEIFARSIARGRIVTGFVPNAEATGTSPPRPAGFAHRGPDPTSALQSFPAATVNLPAISNAAAGNGSFAIVNDFDTVVRRVPLFQTVGGTIYPSLAAEALRVGQGARTHLMLTAGGDGQPVTVTDVKIGRIESPTTANGEVLIYDTGLQPDRYVPAWRVLDEASGPRVAPLIAGHVVLVGTSAAGLKDLRATPLTTSVAGVSVHAQAIEQMILGTHLKRPDWATGLEVVVFVVVGAALVLLLPMVGAFWCSALAVIAIGAGIGASWWAFDVKQFLFDPIYPAFAALAVYLPTTATLFVMTETEKRFVRDAFGRYLSPALVERLAENPDRLTLTGENRELTILFSDIRSFTSFSEAMSPEELTRFMNRYFTAMSDRIIESEGYIDKYIGDAIMAFWNAPLDDPEHAAHACEAVLRMRAALSQLNAGLGDVLAAEHIPPGGISNGIGLHSGTCRVGNMGSDKRFNYSILGDDVNLASRIEGQTKAYGVDILISEVTRAEAGDQFVTLELDRIRVQGRQAPVKVYALIGRRAEIDMAAFEAFEADHLAMLDAYRAQDWAGAGASVEALATAGPEAPWLPAGCRIDGVYPLYRARIADLAAAPPGPNWDGVFATKK